jgi:hypothetical protein
MKRGMHGTGTTTNNGGSRASAGLHSPHTRDGVRKGHLWPAILQPVTTGASIPSEGNRDVCCACYCACARTGVRTRMSEERSADHRWDFGGPSGNSWQLPAPRRRPGPQLFCPAAALRGQRRGNVVLTR